ncbi:hypothetical protein KSS87_018312 [Heliosperma pusillum]|nr:hypothetical protein KSS87_018312 [Heliosperma pusillum]
MAEYEAIGKAFVDHYYHLFDTERPSLTTLYQPTSLLSFEGQQFEGVDLISTKISSLPFDQCRHLISTIDSQPSGITGGIIIFVSGSLQLGGEEHPLRFSQRREVELGNCGSIPSLPTAECMSTKKLYLDVSATNLHLNFINSVPSNTLSSNNAFGDFYNAKSGLSKAAQLRTFLGYSVDHIKNTKTLARNVKSRILSLKNNAAIDICIHLLDMSMDRLLASVVALGHGELGLNYFDVHTWLSGVLTNHDTCLDGLEVEARLELESRITDLMAQANAFLSMLLTLSPTYEVDKQVDLHNKLTRKFPVWLTRMDSNLLEALPKEIVPNVVVAQDGSGDYLTVVEAIDSAPKRSDNRYVIYVKQGTYVENVRIKSSKTNIMLIGDGMGFTIITGSLNHEDGVPTFDTGTLIVEGDGFIGQDLWIMNTAGPEKHQAVALRVSADKTVINRCRIDTFQDTLYTHKDRQFYRDCTIKGTIDFIFGNAAVVLQNCTIVARRPLDGQSNMITAQSKKSPLQNTGISIQMSRIRPSKYLKPVQHLVKTYLGRPWRNYSTTVIMQSNIESHIDPLGWAKWNDDTDTSLLYYGEYNNTGPGAGTENRVAWSGFHMITDPNVAMNFTVGGLIQGGSWLSSTGVNYIEGLDNGRCL